MGIKYATREAVKGALDVRETAYANAQIDEVLETASRSAEAQLHRIFYPVLATKYFDWPRSFSTPWILRLDQNELISASAITSGGVVLSPADYFLEPVNYGPPYNQVQIDLGSSASFTSGSTFQRNVAITGLWGYNNDSAAAGSLENAIADASTTSVDVTDSSLIGVGTLITVGSERMNVIEKSMLSTSQTGSLTDSNADVSLTVADGTKFHAGETILMGAERMRVDAIAGNVLTVKRAFDGSVLQSHSSATIYALRTLTVERGVLGTTATSHTDASSIARYVAPGPVFELALAEAITLLQQRQSAYARTVASGDAIREVLGRGLEDIRRQTILSHGRKARHRAV